MSVSREAISLGKPRMSPQQFSAKWASIELKESASSREHFLDLCALVGSPTPADVDKKGEFFTFEKGVEKSGGGKGFADVWCRGRFAIEYKGKHKDLTAAYNQLLQYHESLENPPLLVVTDIDRYEIHTKFDRTVTEVHRFTNAELPDPENLRILRALFEDPDRLRPARTVESVTEEAAAKFARLADGMRARGIDSQEAAHFLNRLLFCLFTEDVGLLPGSIFTRVVDRSVKRPESFNQNVSSLFDAMSNGGEFGLQDIPWFNGGLFSGGGVVSLKASELKVLSEAARLDWGSVEPAIFGTLFERSLDPGQRARLGAHYTSREDILALIEPVLMAPLRREWEQVKATAEAEAERAREQTGQKARNALQRAERGLTAFVERLRRERILDPACGSGNFLYVSLKQLLNLEKEVSRFAGEIGLTPPFPGVNPEQLYGIETNPYAHELAQVAIWIGYLQWMIDNGFGSPREPILGPMTNIVEMDAILDRQDGQVREPEWPEADVIVGNPPFLGGKRMRTELEDGYVDDLFTLYDDRVPREADLVTYWFEKARQEIKAGRVERAGLLATNSIRGGANRKVLQRIQESGGIFFAESDREWIQNGAAVRVSMVGFDGGEQAERVLDGAPAEEIYADLTGSFDLTGAKPLPENYRIAFQGPVVVGPFDIVPETAEKLLRGYNPHGRPNSDVIFPVVNAADLTKRKRGRYIIDFGQRSQEDASLYEAPFEYIREHVKPLRDHNRDRQRREYWWRHGRAGTQLRAALANKSRQLATPRVAKHRLFVWLPPDTVVTDAVVAFARDDDYFFGVLHSQAHELWALRMGTFLGVGNDPRYTPTTCFETFPLPWPPGEEPEGDPRVEAIAEAARILDERRRNWLDPEGASEAELKKRTLTNLYNARPTWLANAHAALDRAVFAAYGWPEDISDEEILKNLLALNLERAGQYKTA